MLFPYKPRRRKLSTARALAAAAALFCSPVAPSPEIPLAPTGQGAGVAVDKPAGDTMAGRPISIIKSETPRIVFLQPAVPARTWEDWFEKLVQVAAVVIGGFWVWANYLLNRTHRARLEGRITADALRMDGGLVKVVLGLRNVGLSKVSLSNEGTAVRVASLDPKLSRNAVWRDRMTISVWNSVDWVEPGESCEEQHLLKIPLVSKYPIKFELYVNREYLSFPLRRRVSQTLRASYVLPPAIVKDEVPT